MDNSAHGRARVLFQTAVRNKRRVPHNEEHSFFCSCADRVNLNIYLCPNLWFNTCLHLPDNIDNSDDKYHNIQPVDQQYKGLTVY